MSIRRPQCGTEKGSEEGLEMVQQVGWALEEAEGTYSLTCAIRTTCYAGSLRRVLLMWVTMSFDMS
jgi:hypothetical protein